jgi:multimeric flavodoxin WrbA
MKALAVCGSPHRNGNTEDLLKRAVRVHRANPTTQIPWTRA